jgi:hypothetical protein
MVRIGTLTLGTIRRYHARWCDLRHRAPVRVPCHSIWHPDYGWPRVGTINSGEGRGLPLARRGSRLGCQVVHAQSTCGQTMAGNIRPDKFG